MASKGQNCNNRVKIRLHHFNSVFLSTQNNVSTLSQVLSEILSKEIETGNAETRASAIDNSVAQNRTQSSDQQNEEQSEGRKLLATMLCLTVVICKKLIDKDDFTRVALDDAALIRKLTEILEKNNSATPDCLGVAKFTCQLVIVMVQFKPSCIEHINEHSFEEVLSKALKTMRDLDYCMLFAGSNHEMMMHATSLAYLVEEAQELFATAQQSLANINHS